MKYPLEGIKVVELARVLAGPWVGQVLSDLGAEVIKIESPEGDETRKWGPPFVQGESGDLDSAYLDMAEIWARLSKARRKQVGCLIVKNILNRLIMILTRL